MKINTRFVSRVLCTFIREELAKFGFKKGIIGLSGGLDSSVCAALAAMALGPKNVLGLILPYKNTFKAELRDAQTVAGKLGIRWKMIDIAPMVDAYFSCYPTQDRVRIGNKMTRERMSILYDFSAQEKALVLGTSNKTELLLGYGTIHGDMASAVNPLGDLYKTQVRQLASYLKLPAKIQKKTPTAGLWPGQTDEGELGLTYAQIDRILFELIDERKSPEEAAAAGFPKEAVEKIAAMIVGSEFKRKLPPIPKISARTVGLDFLYPYDRNR
ncbi:MAG: NAD+ synthase [Acidobacteriota bacterium]